ncbi:unnamed protein product, partial [Hapterophycus canaliculatus]
MASLFRGAASLLMLMPSASSFVVVQPASLTAPTKHQQQHQQQQRLARPTATATEWGWASRAGRASGILAFQSRSGIRMSSTAAEVVDASVVGDEFEAKTNLLKQIDLSSSKRMRTEVNELMLKLEPMNPTEKPAGARVLNGVWEFLYTGGLSPGTLAVQVLSRVAKTFSSVVDLDGITLTISRDQPRVEAAVKATVFGTQAQVKVRTRLEQKSDMRLQEVYEEAEVAGVTIPIPARIQPRRTLYITYLDDDIMIARDDTGAPDLLIRKQK